MSRLEDRIRRAGEDLAGEAPDDAVDRLAHRKRRHRIAHRAQAAGLAITVIAASTGGAFALFRAFDGEPRTVAGPPADGDKEIAMVAGDTDIYAVSPATGTSRRITSGEAFDAVPRWSPNRERLLFIRRSGPRSSGHVMVVNSDGTDLTRVTSGEGIYWDATWSPDGKQIAATRSDSSGGRIYLMTTDGADLRRLVDIESGEPSWSPDGRLIAFSGNEEGGEGDTIYTIDVRTQEMQPLFSAPDTLNFSPAWSPDGRHIAFVRVRVETGDGQTATLGSDLFIMNADGTDPRRLGSHEPNSAPTWSPDGKRILFVSQTGKSSSYELFVVGREDGLSRPFRVPPLRGGDPDWASIAGPGVTGEPATSVPTPSKTLPALASGPDGLIVFASIRNGNRELYAIEPNGRGLRQLTHTSFDESGPALSGSRIAYTTATPLGASSRAIDPQDTAQLMIGDTYGSAPLPIGEHRRDPAWSPFEDLLAFTEDRGGTVLVVAASDGSAPRRLTDGESSSSFAPTWSPDGRRIAFTRDVLDDRVHSEIWVIGADGRGESPLVQLAGDAYFPSWSRDGKHIAFVNLEDGNANIWILRLSDRTMKRLTDLPGDEGSPSWSPDGKSLVFDSRGDLYIVEASGASLRKLLGGPGSHSDPSWDTPVDGP